MTMFGEYLASPPTLTDGDQQKLRLDSTGALVVSQLTAQALATEATLASVLTELQTLNAALVTANGHLAAIETNTGTP